MLGEAVEQDPSLVGLAGRGQQARELEHHLEVPLLDFAREAGREVTLLTPPLTNSGMEKCSHLLECVGESHPDAEVVFNDWGMLSLLKEKYQGFSIAAGRLLDRGFKDPRLLDPKGFSSSSIEASTLLGSSSFDQRQIQKKLLELGVTRVERDLLPYAERAPAAMSGLETSIYFPFGYLATGRVCWMSGFDPVPAERFVPLRECAGPCRRAPLRMKSDSFTSPVIQSGNTLYYLYTASMLETILGEANRAKHRLVYQGFAV